MQKAISGWLILYLYSHVVRILTDSIVQLTWVSDLVSRGNTRLKPFQLNKKTVNCNITPIIMKNQRYFKCSYCYTYIYHYKSTILDTCFYCGCPQPRHKLVLSCQQPVEMPGKYLNVWLVQHGIVTACTSRSSVRPSIQGKAARKAALSGGEEW